LFLKKILYHLLIILCLNPNLLIAGETHEFMLDNGLKLLVKTDHRAPVVVSQVWYKVGSSYEHLGKTGLSHMLEHMMFQGTEHHPAGEFSQIMAVNGARENAFTSQDYTAYYQILEKSRLAISFELEADRMRHLLLSEEEFAKEHKVVLEERLLRTEDNPNSLLYEHFNATAFQTSPYQNPVVGWRNDIENYQLADLQNWYEHWYAPNNATVVVVGDVEPQAVFTLAKQYFGGLKPSQLIPPDKHEEIKQLGVKRVIVKRPAKLPYLVMGYKVPVLKTLSPENYWEAYALDVLTNILDGGESARFSRYLTRGQEIATSVYASYDMTARLTDLLTFGGVPTANHSIEELEQAIKKQINQLQTTLVTPEELERVKIQARSSTVYEKDSLFYQAMEIGVLETVGLDWRLTERYLEKIEAVTPEQIQTVARKYLIEDNLTVGILEPLPLNDELGHPTTTKE
jgi:zinc protease